MRIIDFHSHFFSRPFFDTLAASAPGTGSVDERLAALCAQTGIELPPEDVAVHTARWLAELDRHGVERLCSFASVPEEAGALAEAVALAAGRLLGFTVVNPGAAGCVEALQAHMASGAFRGILLFPALHHFDVSGGAAGRVLEVVEAHGGIAFVHCGLLVVKIRDLLGLPRPYDLAYANPLSLIPAANRYRRVRFVIPHFGAGYFRETLMAGAQCENVFVDTSSSNSWVRTQPALAGMEAVFRKALGVFGSERVLFGTDANVFPAGWRADRLQEQRELLDACGVSDADQALIFGHNAARLLALPSLV